MITQSEKKPYFLICPDYQACLGYFSLDNCSYGCDDDIIELEGCPPVKIPGIEDWCWEWDEQATAAMHGKPHEFNIKKWHDRGMAFAQLLRQALPDSIDVIYHRGDNNITLEKIQYFAFSPDTNFVIGDTNIGTEEYFGDVVDVAYFTPIDVPGLDKWWNEFDDHVDYVKSTADSDFDWATWYVRGLEMAKLIRKGLPSSVRVWYRIPFEIRDIFPVRDLVINEDGSCAIGDFLKDK